MPALQIARDRLRQEARQEGLQEGLQAKEKNVILNMLKDNINIEDIVKYTGASKERVLELQQQASL